MREASNLFEDEAEDCHEGRIDIEHDVIVEVCIWLFGEMGGDVL